jgi:hypothetical protein
MMGRLHVFLVLELFLLVLSFIVVLLPRRGTTDLIHLPPDLVTYLGHAVLVFGAMNGLLLVIAGMDWIIRVARGRPDQGRGEQDS